MSHFTVTVCLPAGTDLAKVDDLLGDVMERWDENRRVEPYRSYEEGPAGEYWFATHLRRVALDYRNGTGIKPYEPNGIGWSSASGKETPEQQREAQGKETEWAVRLGVDPDNDGKIDVTWEKVAELHNERYGHGSALALPGDDSDSEKLYYDADEGRAYTISTYNPESMWDYWRIGGRWREHFVIAPGVFADQMIQSPRGWDSPEPKDGPIRCCGGPKKWLDFEAMRDEAAVEANARFDEWDKICQTTPHADPWSHFHGLATLGEITWDEARERYGKQTRIVAVRQHEDLRWHDDVVTEFMSGREEYVEQARVAAVPGYALITLEREWMAPGRMGWFGMSSDGPGEKHAYKVEANRYLDSLPDDAVIVQLDCHI